MKKFLLASAAGAMLILPAISGASTVSFEGNQLMFDPSGCTPSSLPKTGFYRSYDCRIGGQITLPVVTFTPPPKNDGPKGGNNPPSNNNPSGPYIPPPPDNTPPGNTPNNPVIPPQGPTCDPHPPHCAAVPAPNSGVMAGIGLAAMSLFGWIRNRRQARA